MSRPKARDGSAADSNYEINISDNWTIQSSRSKGIRGTQDP